LQLAVQSFPSGRHDVRVDERTCLGDGGNQSRARRELFIATYYGHDVKSDRRTLLSLDELAEHPEQVVGLSPEKRAQLVLSCSAIIAAAAAGMATGTADPLRPSFEHPNPELLTYELAAEFANVPVSWVRQIVKAGRLASVKLGHYRRIKADDLERFVEKCREHTQK
jgi:excisionase family DNA binding protein